MRGLTGELAANNIDALLINIHDEVGAILRERFDFTFSPTFLVFTPQGDEVYRANTVPRLDDIRLALALEAKGPAQPVASR